MNPWVLLAGLLIVAAAAGGGYYYGYDHAELWWVAEDSKRAAERAEAKAQAEREAREKEQAATAAQTKERERYEARILVSDKALAAALAQLRDAHRLRAREPAASAPAECERYEAPAGRLSMQDAEFLTREADRADRIVVQLDAAQREIVILRNAFGLPTEETP